MVHVLVMFLSEWREFPPAPCLALKKLDDSQRLDVLKSRASPDIFLFSLCNKKILAIRHMKMPLFPTILSIPSYDMEKYVGLRTYQHPLAYSLNRASWYTYVKITNKMHAFSHLFIPFKLCSTCFEQIIVHHQEVISVHAAYITLSCIYGYLAANMVWLDSNHTVLAARHP